MQSVVSLLFNVAIAAGLYFGFIVLIGSRAIGEAAIDAATFAAIYGAIQVGVLLYRKGKQ